MKRSNVFSAVLILTILLLLSLGSSTAQGPDLQETSRTQALLGSAFTYQGRLVDDGTPVDDTCDLQFGLWDDLSAGSLVAGPLNVTGAAVSDGRFTAQLDFGQVFTGTAFWLEIAVQCSGDAGYTTLSPRQPLTPTPYAMALPGLWTQPNITSTNLIGGYGGNSVTDGVVGATIGGGGNVSGTNRITNDYGTIGGGVNNTITQWNSTIGGGKNNLISSTSATIAGGENITVTGHYAAVGGGYYNTASGNSATVAGGAGNSASNWNATVGGGNQNEASGLKSTIGGGEYNVASEEYATVAGGYDNSASVNGATVGGGAGNIASNWNATVSGGNQNEASGPKSTIGGGEYNVASEDYATIGGGWNNEASNTVATVGGGHNNIANAIEATVGGGLDNIASGQAASISGGRGNQASGWSATIGGGESNSAISDTATIGGGEGNTASGYASVIGGGGGLWQGVLRPNVASGYASTVGGGQNHVANGQHSTIGGGWESQASGRMSTIAGGEANIANSDHSTIGGGLNNSASNGSATVGGGYQNSAGGGSATVGGGNSNTANGDDATVGGGYDNSASGFRATVPGGASNSAAGQWSFAAGRRAKANHDGSFVWADSTDADFASERDNQARVRADGGVYFDINNDDWFDFRYQIVAPPITFRVLNTSTGAYLSAGGVWTNSSDRNKKENFAPVDGMEVLSSLAELPITTWNYKAEDAAIHHMGPVAQDFYAVFGLGGDDTHIASMDTSGVALAAIQGLYDLVQEKDTQIATQQVQINDLEARLTALEAATGSSGPDHPGSSELLPGAGILLAMMGVVWVTRRRGSALSLSKGGER